MSLLVNNLVTGNQYSFKIRALNFNGAGLFSSQVTYFSCLPPLDLLPPQFVSATNTSLTVTWGEPKQLNGCPIYKFNLIINDGISPQNSVMLEPDTNLYTINTT